MIIYPAIDLQNGKCVRLSQGNFADSKVYAHDPVKMAQWFQDQGATWLHIVDLDAAQHVNNSQRSLIAKIIKSTTLNIQVGGGVRRLAQIEDYRELGAKRVIIGSMAYQNPQLVKQWIEIVGVDQIVLAFDCYSDESGNTNIAVQGWQEKTKMSLTNIIEQFQCRHVLCTDIQRDGMLCGANIELYTQLNKQFPGIQLQASGGVATAEDLQKLRKINISGVIIGKAIYEKPDDFLKFVR